jgi:AhpC/TSA family
MAPSELGGEEASPSNPSQPAEPPRYGRYVGLLAIVILIFITINTLVTKPHGVSGVTPGEPLPPFAVPLASGDLKGDANVAATGAHAACTVRKGGVLNICELYEQGPVVLVLFVNGGSCPDVLGDLEKLAPSFPKVRFAAVSIKGDRASLRRLIAREHLTYPVGLDDKGDLAALYRLASCPQVSFALKGGVVQSKAMLSRPSPATLRSRIAGLAAASEAAHPAG